MLIARAGVYIPHGIYAVKTVWGGISLAAMNGRSKLLKLDSRAWHGQVARLIAAVETPQFASVLVAALEHVVPFDHSVLFAYHGQDRPICLFDTFDPQQRIVFVSDYQEGPYLLDPFYQVCAERIDPGLYRLREIAPDRFYHSQYYRSYYRRTGLAEEICFVHALPDDMMLVVSLMRAGTSACFSDRDMAKLLIDAIQTRVKSIELNELEERLALLEETAEHTR